MLPKLKDKFAKNDVWKKHKEAICVAGASIVIFFLLFISLLLYEQQRMQKAQKLQKTLSITQKSLQDLKNQDQYKINQKLTEDLKKTHDTYTDSIGFFEKIQDLKVQKQDTIALETTYAAIVKDLSDLHVASAEAKLTQLAAGIKKVQDSLLAATATGPNVVNAPASNTPPGSGYAVQQVKTDAGTFAVSMVAGDLSSTKIVVDTASDSDCKDNCPVMSLGDYVARSGAYAGINGSYFCPSTYPSCAGKSNSYDLLVMNKNKKYFNSDNNVYSTNPAVIFSNGGVRFVGKAQEWGRDTSVDGVLSNFPLLVAGNNAVNADGGGKGLRGFVANKGNIVYIGFVHNATAGEAAQVLKALGMENAMGLDQGGSTALWSGGYKLGPGRAIPNAILFLRK